MNRYRSISIKSINMKSRFLLLSLLTCSNAFGAVALVFSDFGDQLTNRSNTAGLVAVDGLDWGILIASGTSTDFSQPLLGQVGLSMADGANLGNDYIFYYGGVTAPVGIPSPGNGAIVVSSALSYPTAYTNKPFAIIWFDSTSKSDLAPGLNYGLIRNSDLASPNLIAPSPDTGGEVSFSSNFSGVESISSTNLTLVPEPSTALLGLLGLAGLLRRKR
jgi:hypothetical protein